MAHKKAAGAAKNLRDSQPKYRGIKLFGGQKAVAWNIIVRQNGSKYECGANTYLASDFSIHAATDWIVMFKQKNFKRFDGRTYLKTVVYVAPEAEVKAGKKAPAKKAAPKAEAKKEEILNALKEHITDKKIIKINYNLAALISLNENPRKIRETIIKKYHLIPGNNKNIENQLNILKVSKEELWKLIEVTSMK